MNHTKRISPVILVPALLFFLGAFGAGCSNKDDNNAALQAAYLAALASATATSSSGGTVVISQTNTVTSVATSTVTSPSTSTSITIIN